jgi:hypothetical protein
MLLHVSPADSYPILFNFVRHQNPLSTPPTKEGACETAWRLCFTPLLVVFTSSFSDASLNRLFRSVDQESVWHCLRNEAKEMRPDASRRPGKPEVYSLEYIRGFFLAENDADGRGSFAAVERSLSDRLLVCRRSRKANLVISLWVLACSNS